jgi:DMSO reductase family type II enzyme heme b subunit
MAAQRPTRAAHLLRCLVGALPAAYSEYAAVGPSSAPRIWTTLVGRRRAVSTEAGRRRRMIQLAFAFGGAMLAAASLPSAVFAQQGDANAGKAVYEARCALCHGVKGDGKGPAAELLLPAPRDFTTGVYKIRSTANKVPADQDLFRIVTEGMPGTSMPPWNVLPEKDRWNVVAYIKTFAGDKLKEPPKKLELPKDVASSDASIKRGREMFEAIECHKCHGNAGRADGPSRPELKDDWGHPVAPANLTQRWTFRGGANRTEIATRIAAGVLGTPMPSFIDSVEKPEDIWHLTNYIVSLGPDRPAYATLVTVNGVTDAIPDDPNADFWKNVPVNAMPLMGQVIVDPRNFNPAIELLRVRAVYNDKEVAFHLTWDDPSQTAADAAKKTPGDAVSIQFPPKFVAGSERPYFLMGDDNEPVYLLRWEAGQAGEFAANGPAKLKALDAGAVVSKTVYDNGQYRVVIKRPLAGKGDSSPTFQPSTFVPVAFQAWDAGAGESGPKMSLTSWYYLRLEPPQSNRRFVVPPVVALLTLVVMVVVVRAANRARR